MSSRTSWNLRSGIEVTNVHIIDAICLLIYPSTSAILLDEVTLDAPTVRRRSCQWFIHGGSASVMCELCVKHWATLTIQSQREQSVSADASISSHINYKYLYIFIHVFVMN